MSHRQFRDSKSVDWDVWEVMPTIVDKLVLDRRSSLRVADAPPSHTEEWLLPAAGMSKGWLLFECAQEKRRLVPIPNGWLQLTNRELESLCRQATPAPRAPARSLDPPAV